MARTTVDALGVVASTTIGVSGGTFDVFASNQGEGALRVVISWTDGEFTDVFIPPTAHRVRRDLSINDVLILDSNEVIQLVAVRPDTPTPASSNLEFTGQKTHVTAASTGNDFFAVGIGSRT